jgi:hypothetical protein
MLSRAESCFLNTDNKNPWVFINPFSDLVGDCQLQDSAGNEPKFIEQVTNISQILLNRGSRFARKWDDTVRVYHLKRGVRVWTWFVWPRILSSDRSSRAKYCGAWVMKDARWPTAEVSYMLFSASGWPCGFQKQWCNDVIAQVYITKTKDRTKYFLLCVRIVDIRSRELRCVVPVQLYKVLHHWQFAFVFDIQW